MKIDHNGLAAVVAHEQAFVGHALAHELSENGFAVVGSCPNLLGLETLEPAGEPDLVILGWGGGRPRDLEGVGALIARRWPEAKVALVLGEVTAEAERAARAAGFGGCLPFDMPPHMMLAALSLVAAGSECYDGRRGPEPGGQAWPTTSTGELTSREGEVLALVAAGLPNKLIARHLGIAESTVKSHVKQVLRKIGVTNRTQAAAWALGSGGPARQ